MYWVLLVFYWVLLGFTGFYWVFTRFYWVLLGFTGFYWVLLGFTKFSWVSLGSTGFYWVLLGFTGFYRVLPGFPGYETEFDRPRFDLTECFLDFHHVLKLLAFCSSQETRVFIFNDLLAFLIYRTVFKRRIGNGRQ